MKLNKHGLELENTSKLRNRPEYVRQIPLFTKKVFKENPI